MTSLILQAISSSCCLPVVRRMCFLLRDSSDQTNREHQARGRIPIDGAAVETRQRPTSCGTSLGWISLRYVCDVLLPQLILWREPVRFQTRSLTNSSSGSLFFPLREEREPLERGWVFDWRTKKIDDTTPAIPIARNSA